jgi:hypothetical protein
MRRFLNLLAARGLVQISIKGRTVLISLTEVGKRIAVQLADRVEYRLIAARAHVLKRRLDIGATQLMNFIYETFPEIGSLDFDETIQP